MYNNSKHFCGEQTFAFLRKKPFQLQLVIIIKLSHKTIDFEYTEMKVKPDSKCSIIKEQNFQLSYTTVRYFDLCC